MILNIYFIVAFLALLIGLICVDKVPRKISLLKSSIIFLISLLCIGAFIAQIYALCDLKIDLFSIGTAYLVISFLIWGIILKKGKFQKLEIKKIEVYVFGIIVICFGLLFIKVFTLDIKNVYINSDPAIHYQLALNVLDTKTISRMHFAELYNGLILGFFEPFVQRENLYKAFILADSFANFLNILMFYVLAETIVKSKIIKYLLPVWCLLYFLGWPFFCYVLGGYIYHGWGVTLFAYVIYLLIVLYKSEERKIQMALTLLVLLGCFGELVCYMIFAPILAIIVFVCLILTGKKNGFVPSKKILIGIYCFLLVCFVVALTVFMGFFDGNIKIAFSSLQVDGWIHKDLYRDFAAFLPAAIYIGWHYCKNRTVDIIIISLGITLAITGVAFVGCLCNLVSPYYYYKTYYLLWLLFWLVFIKAIEFFKENDKVIMLIYILAVVSPMIMTLTGAEAWLVEKGVVYDEKGNRHYPSLMPILDRNEFFLSGEQRQIEDRDALVEICQYINKQFSEEKVMPLVIGDGCAEIWYEAFTDKESISVNDKEKLQKILLELQSECNYLVIYKNTDLYRENKSLVDGYKFVYDNGYYGIVELEDKKEMKNEP